MAHEEWLLMSHGTSLAVNQHPLQRRVPRPTFMLNSVSVHSDLEAFFQSTGATLIAMRLVNLTEPVGFWLANILTAASNRALEKASTSIASVDAIMFTGAVISANFARDVVENSTWGKEKRKISWNHKANTEKFLLKLFVWNAKPLFVIHILQEWFYEWGYRKILAQKCARIAMLLAQSIMLHSKNNWEAGITFSMEVSTGASRWISRKWDCSRLEAFVRSLVLLKPRSWLLFFLINYSRFPSTFRFVPFFCRCSAKRLRGEKVDKDCNKSIIQGPIIDTRKRLSGKAINEKVINGKRETKKPGNNYLLIRLRRPF